MDEVAYYIRGLLRQPNASLARTYLGITGGGGGGAAISAGAQSQNTGTVIFSNSNNITFGLNLGTLTASFAAGAGGSINFSAGTTSNNLASVTFSNANGITFGLNAGVITASHNGITIFPRLDQVLNPTVDKVFAMPANVGLQFQYAAGASFSTNATRQGMFEIDVIGNATGGADVMHIHQSVANPQIHLLHLDAAGTGVTLLHMDAAASIAAEINAPLKFTGGSVPMVLGTSQSNVVSNLNAFYLEGARSSQFLTSQSNQAASASNGSFTFQTLNFSNANNVTFGTSAGGIVSASAAVPGMFVSGGTTASQITHLVFSNISNVSFGFATGVGAGTITAIVPAQTNQTVGLYAVSNTTLSTFATADARSITFAGAGVASVGASNGSVVISVPAGGGAAIRGIAAGASTATENTVNFSNLNGISFGFGTAGNSTVITASHNALTAVAASASNGSFTFSTLNFSNANNVTFGTSAGGIISASVAAQSTQPVAASASNGSFLFSTIAFSNANNVTFGTSAGSIVTASVAAPGGGAAPKSYFQWPHIVANSSAVQFSGSTKQIQPFLLPYDLSVSYLRMPITLSCVGSNADEATVANQTVGATISSTFQLAFYSMGVGASSLSLQAYFTTQHTWVQQLTIQAGATGSHWTSGHTISYPMSSSASAVIQLQSAATSGSRTMNSSVISDFTGLRFLDLLMPTSFSAGAWWMAFNSSSTLSTSVSNFLSTQRILASNFAMTQPAQSVNLMGAGTFSSNLYLVGLGSWSTDVIATTASIGLANISRGANNPVLNFEMIRQA